MSSVEHWLNESIYINNLSKGCLLCANGSKMVVLITGLCSASCFYCPLSNKKGGKDLIFADEWQLSNENDKEKLIQEAELINAEGAGITGGDPLIVWKRTKDYISLLKNHFGDSFHIHLYTAGLKNIDKISHLIASGLDEIRFHPRPHEWKNMGKSIVSQAVQIALDSGIETTIEIPIIPHMKEDIMKLINWANQSSIHYINLNELEFSERNEEVLYQKGFKLKNVISSAVLDSQKDAYEIIYQASDTSIQIGMHYCSSSFKDGIQLRNRILRRAKNIATSLDIITDEGTILKGIIEYKEKNQLVEIINFLKTSYNLEDDEIITNESKKYIQIPIYLLEKIAGVMVKKGANCYISEHYPTADNLEVERTPIR